MTPEAPCGMDGVELLPPLPAPSLASAFIALPVDGSLAPGVFIPLNVSVKEPVPLPPNAAANSLHILGVLDAVAAVGALATSGAPKLITVVPPDC